MGDVATIRVHFRSSSGIKAPSATQTVVKRSGFLDLQTQKSEMNGTSFKPVVAGAHSDMEVRLVLYAYSYIYTRN